MAWRDWVRGTAIRLGISEPGSVPVDLALDNLDRHERRVMALRMSLLEQATRRGLYVEEIVAYDSARANVYAESKELRAELVRLGVPSFRLPSVGVLAPLPASVQAGVQVRPATTALGAVRVGVAGVDPSRLRGGDWAGTLGAGLTVVQALGFAAAAVLVIGSAAALTYILVDLVNPEIGLQQSITEHDLGIAEAVRDIATEWEETRQAAIEQGVDPTTLTPPDMGIFEELADDNPGLGAGFSAAKSIAWAVVAAGAIFIGYKVWKSRGE